MKKETALQYLLILAICYLEYRLLMMLHSGNLENQLLIVLSPLEGQAWWRAFQNRLLAGTLVSLVGYNLFFLVTIAVKNILFYKLTKDVISTLLFVMLFVLLQDSRWLIAWDMLDVIFITIMLMFYVKKLPGKYYAVLFAVAIFNRESALFIPLFLMIDAFINKKSFALPFTLMAAGVIIVLLLREQFITSTQSYIGLDSANEQFGNHYYLADNLKSFFREWMPKDKQLSFIPGILFTTIIYLFNKNKLLSVWMMLVFIITMLVGVIHETRVWLIIVPVIILAFRSESGKGFKIL